MFILLQLYFLELDFIVFVKIYCILNEILDTIKLQGECTFLVLSPTNKRFVKLRKAPYQCLFCITVLIIVKQENVLKL